MQKTFSWHCEEIMSMMVQINAKPDYLTVVTFSGEENTIYIRVENIANKKYFYETIYLTPGFLSDEKHITGQLEKVMGILNNILKGKEVWKTL